LASDRNRENESKKNGVNRRGERGPEVEKMAGRTQERKEKVGGKKHGNTAQGERLKVKDEAREEWHKAALALALPQESSSKDAGIRALAYGPSTLQLSSLLQRFCVRKKEEIK
jgi:hypothetical protein